jgi:hypothetical protein
VTKTHLVKSDFVPTGDAAAAEPAWLVTLRQQVASLRFGVVQVVVHDGRVVQIERTEKTRFDSTSVPAR